MNTFRIGIIGYGGFGRFLHNAWRELKEVQVIAVADELAHKTEGLEQVKTFTDWRDLLREKDIDLLVIATIPSTHEVIATACLQAGKPILIEKPLATTLSGAHNIIRMRDRTQTVAAIDFIMRFNPLLQEFRDLSRQGTFGKLRRAAVENYAQDQQLPPEHWFWDPELSGGILVEHGVHFIDLIHWLNPAKALAVNGLKHDRNPQQEDQVMANVLYEGGLAATHYHSFARPGFFEKTSIKLAYDLADIELHGWIPLLAELKALVNPETKRVLLSCPFFEVTASIPVEKVSDASRPAGWGPSDHPGDSNRRTIRSGGISYDVNEMVTGRYNLNQSKQEVYTGCVQKSLLDLLRKISNPDHPLAAPLEAGLASLEVAVRATASARRKLR